jgi:hypothetical protein
MGTLQNCMQNCANRIPRARTRRGLGLGLCTPLKRPSPNVTQRGTEAFFPPRHRLPHVHARGPRRRRVLVDFPLGIYLLT